MNKFVHVHMRFVRSSYLNYIYVYSLYMCVCVCLCMYVYMRMLYTVSIFMETKSY